MGTIILLVMINSFFIFNAGSNYILEPIVNKNETTCHLNQKHWNFIKWFFQRCTYIEITEIALNKSHQSQFSNHIIQGLVNGNLNHSYKPVPYFLIFFFN